MVNRLCFLIFLSAAMLFSVSCKKDNGILGTDVQPQGDLIKAESLKSFAVDAFSMKYDSVLSLNTDLKYLGYNNDPKMGTLDVGLCLNAGLSLSNVSFSAATEVTGANLVIAVSNTNYAGNPNASLNYTVYALDSALTSTRVYYTSNTRLFNPQKILGAGTSSFVATLKEKVITFSLSQTFAQELATNNAALVSNSTFQAAYKGFYIKTSASGEGIVYGCNLGADTSGFYLQYKTANNANNAFKFEISGTAISRFNTVKFTPIPALASQFAGDSAKGADGLYVKGLGASRLKVRIPFLKNYGDTFKLAVNRAEVIFYPDPSYLASVDPFNYRLPAKLTLLAMDSLGREALTIDQRNSTYISRYDGNYDESNKRYVFNIPLHAQAIFSGRIKNYGFYLVVADPDPVFAGFRDINLGGCVLSGTSAALKPVFNIDYIRLKND